MKERILRGCIEQFAVFFDDLSDASPKLGVLLFLKGDSHSFPGGILVERLCQ